jgi:hypothetical protein
MHWPPSIESLNYVQVEADEVEVTKYANCMGWVQVSCPTTVAEREEGTDRVLR